MSDLMSNAQCFQIMIVIASSLLTFNELIGLNYYSMPMPVRLVPHRLRSFWMEHVLTLYSNLSKTPPLVCKPGNRMHGEIW